MKRFIPLLLCLVACAPVEKDTAEFDKWFKQVTSEPYDPANGSIY